MRFLTLPLQALDVNVNVNVVSEYLSNSYFFLTSKVQRAELIPYCKY